MLREETEYDEILTCDHSYDNRCHTSYVTRYEPVQEQHCDEKFRKVKFGENSFGMDFTALFIEGLHN